MASGDLTVRDAIKTAGDLEKVIDDSACLYLQAVANFAEDDEESGLGPPTCINDVVGLEPTDEDTYGVPNAVNGWQYAGDTKTLNFGNTRTTRRVVTDQHPEGIEKHQSWAPIFSGTLSQFEDQDNTLDILLAVLGGGSMSDVAGASPAQKRVKIPLGSTMEFRRAALLIPHLTPTGELEKTILLIVRKGVIKLTGDISFAGQTQGGIPFNIEASYDDRSSVPSDEQLIYGFFAPGV